MISLGDAENASVGTPDVRNSEIYRLQESFVQIPKLSRIDCTLPKLTPVGFRDSLTMKEERKRLATTKQDVLL